MDKLKWTGTKRKKEKTKSSTLHREYTSEESWELEILSSPGKSTLIDCTMIDDQP